MWMSLWNIMEQCKVLQGIVIRKMRKSIIIVLLNMKMIRRIFLRRMIIRNYERKNKYFLMNQIIRMKLRKKLLSKKEKLIRKLSKRDVIMMIMMKMMMRMKKMKMMKMNRMMMMRMRMILRRRDILRMLILCKRMIFIIWLNNYLLFYLQCFQGCVFCVVSNI